MPSRPPVFSYPCKKIHGYLLFQTLFSRMLYSEQTYERYFATVCQRADLFDVQYSKDIILLRAKVGKVCKQPHYKGLRVPKLGVPHL